MSITPRRVFFNLQKEEEMKSHRCSGMRCDLEYRKVDGIWCLCEEYGDSFAILATRAGKCKFCGASLAGGAVPMDTTTVHRCQAMISVEQRRNEFKANQPGDRCYEIKWDGSDGWSLYNKGEKSVRRKNFAECPYCKIHFPFLNQVVIE